MLRVTEVGGSNQRDDFFYLRQREQHSLHDVSTVLELLQLVRGAASNSLEAELDERV